MNKKDKVILIIIASTLSFVFVALAAFAQIGGGISTTQLLRIDDVGIVPIDSSWELGKNDERWAKLWADDIDSTLATIGTVNTGTLTITATSTTAFVVQSDTNTVFTVDTTNGVVAFGGVTPVTGTRITLPQEDDPATPTFAFGDGGFGLYASGDDVIRVSLNGTATFVFASNIFRGQVTSSPQMMNEVASATNPVFTIRSDDDTGLGSAAADTLSFIAGGVETLRMSTTSLGISLAPVFGTRLTLPQENDATTPTLAFGDGDSGFYESIDNQIDVAIGGNQRHIFSNNSLQSSTSAGYFLQRNAGSSTDPIHTFNADTDTGIGRAAADQLSLIAGGVELMRLTQNDAAVDVLTLTGNTDISGRILKTQGADVASNATTTLGTDGNSFELTGTTTVDVISSVDWQEGAIITLICNENVTITHGSATSGTNITILLSGAANFSCTANDTLMLMLSSTTANGQAWREISRTAI